MCIFKDGGFLKQDAISAQSPVTQAGTKIPFYSPQHYPPSLPKERQDAISAQTPITQGGTRTPFYSPQDYPPQPTKGTPRWHLRVLGLCACHIEQVRRDGKG